MLATDDLVVVEMSGYSEVDQRYQQPIPREDAQYYRPATHIKLDRVFATQARLGLDEN